MKVAVMSVLILLGFDRVQAQTRSQVTGDKLTQQAQTLYVSASSGMSSFDSKLASSKESMTTLNTEVGGWFGESRVIGLRVSSRDDKVNFSLNESTSRQIFTDIRLAARVFGVIPSVGLSISEVDVFDASSQRLGLYGTSMNIGLGFAKSLHTGLVLVVDAMRVYEGSRVYDKLSQDSKLGVRDEFDAQISFDLTQRLVDLIVGYRLRRFDVEVAGQSYDESAQGAYAGLRLGIYF